MRLVTVPKFELECSCDLLGNSVAIALFLNHAGPPPYSQPKSSPANRSLSLRSARPSMRVPFPVAFSDLELAIAVAVPRDHLPDDVARVKEWVRSAIDFTESAAQTMSWRPSLTRFEGRSSFSGAKAKGVQMLSETRPKVPAPAAIWRRLCWQLGRALGFRRASPAAIWIARRPRRAAPRRRPGPSVSARDRLDWLRSDPWRSHFRQTRCHRGEQPSARRDARTGTFFDEHNSYLGMKVTIQTLTPRRRTQFVAKSLERATAGRVRALLSGRLPALAMISRRGLFAESW